MTGEEQMLAIASQLMHVSRLLSDDILFASTWGTNCRHLSFVGVEYSLSIRLLLMY